MRSAMCKSSTGRAGPVCPITACGTGCGSAFLILPACGGSSAASGVWRRVWRWRAVMVGLSDTIGGVLHEVFVQKFQWWVILGYVAQILFTMRFVVQWIASERAGKMVMPIAFWFFSIGGGLLLLVYALYIRDPVFILGQSFGVFVYLRN